MTWLGSVSRLVNRRRSRFGHHNYYIDGMCDSGGQWQISRTPEIVATAAALAIVIKQLAGMNCGLVYLPGVH